MITPEYTKAVDEYVDTFRSKNNFHKKTMHALAIVAGSAEANNIFGNSTNSFKALTELVKKHSNEQELINEFFLMCKIKIK